jgi:hypothetical protein
MSPKATLLVESFMQKIGSATRASTVDDGILNYKINKSKLHMFTIQHNIMSCGKVSRVKKILSSRRKAKDLIIVPVQNITDVPYNNHVRHFVVTIIYKDYLHRSTRMK